MSTKTYTRNEKIAIAVAVFVALSVYTFIVTNVMRAHGYDAYRATLFSSDKAELNLASADDRAHVRTEVYRQDYEAGVGQKAEPGDTVYTHYVGMLSDGTVFDTSTEDTAPFEFTVGAGSVITGWDVGVEGMRVGGIRRIVVPSKYAYGDVEVLDPRGHVLIPAHATLVFDIAIIGIQKQP